MVLSDCNRQERMSNKEKDGPQRPDGGVEEAHNATMDVGLSSQTAVLQPTGASGTRFQTLFATMPLGVVYRDGSGRITAANPAAQRLLGRSLNELQGRIFLDGHWRSEDGTDLSWEQYPSIVALRTRQPIHDVTLGLFLPEQGETRWLRVNATPEFHHDEPTPYQVYATFDDITDRVRQDEALRREREALRRSEARLAEAQRLAHVGSWELDLATGERIWSDELFRICGLDPAQGAPDAASLRACYHPDDLPRYEHALSEMLATGEPSELDVRALRPDGEVRWCHLTAAAVRDATGKIARVVGAAADITERVEAEQTLRESHELLIESERRLRVALTGGWLGWWHLDMRTGEYVEFSDLCKAHFGLPPEATLSYTTFRACIHPEDRGYVDGATALALDNRREYIAEYRVLWPDDSVHWVSAHGVVIYDEAGQVVRAIGTTQDITARKLLEAEREQLLTETKRLLAEAREQADRDPLTGLWNHRAFYSRLAEEAARAEQEGTNLAVVMLDIDGFKFFNDAYGHVTGDEVLRFVAGMLQSLSRPGDTVARFGGDEFALLLPDAEYDLATEVEAQLRANLRGMTCWPDQSGAVIPITFSVGAALFHLGDTDGHEAVQQADQRLLRVKTGGEVETEADRVRADATRSTAGFSMLDALVTALDNKDRYTRRHSEDVLDYSLTIARELGLDETEQRMVAVAALLHDVGKIGVPDAILRKPGPLTEVEFEAVKQHPMMRAVMVAAVPGLEGVLDAVRHHHERWDGKGYPSGLKAKESPPMARLMAVADAFSAMTRDRPYRQGMAQEKALAILTAGAGTQWDPACVAALVRALSRS